MSFPFYILQFYFPKGPPASKETTDSCMSRVNQIYAAHPEGLPLSGADQINYTALLFPLFARQMLNVLDFRILIFYLLSETMFLMPFCGLCAAFTTITKDVCKLPSFFSSCLFKKIDVNNTGLVTRSGNNICILS